MKKGIDYTAVGAITFCHDGKGKLVMAKRGQSARDEHGVWDLGGCGGIEFGDTVENTIRKEVNEELDADVLASEFLGYLDVHRNHDNQPSHWVQLVFKVLVDPKQVKNNEPHKFDDLGWFTLDNLPAPLHSQFPNFAKRFGEQLRQK